jgi:small G protein signaling modulator 3
MAQNGAIINPDNYQMMPLNKEKPQLIRSRILEPPQTEYTNTINQFFKLFQKPTDRNKKLTSGDDDNTNNEHQNEPHYNKKNYNLNDSNNNTRSSSIHFDDTVKLKNIMQTEFLVNLREIILKIAHYFEKNDPQMFNGCILNADYSIESHCIDMEKYMDTSKVRQSKRAKALDEFNRTADDELGFKKNDIITVLSTKDEHCWIGELRGEKGWFPSRFVSLIDERNGKVYSPFGDDSIHLAIRDMVRGELAMAIRSIFDHGLKKWNVLGGNGLHPWSFIEEASRKIIEKDFESVYSRLILCKTFRLDEEGKVLTPEELLFRSIQLINLSHDAVHAQLDVKFRSLICIGLNEQCLHIWLEILCSSLNIVEKWYQPWSFIRSPGWVQIKCELRILAQFSFLLNVDGELPDKNKDMAINECIKDMLVKHHLFSWDMN